MVKNLQFTKLIKTGGRLREFNFRLHEGLNGPVYHINVPDGEGGRVYLSFHQKEGKWIWKEEKSVPGWLQDALPQVHEALTEQE